MKNLMVFINAEKKFRVDRVRGSHELNVKVQIDNSLDFWKPEDIVLVTNFPYEHNGIKAQVVPDDLWCQFDHKASKINTILYLLETRQVKPGDLWWFHDLDAFQIEPITREELNMRRLPLGLTDYGWADIWNTGSFFFTNDAERIFGWIRNVVYKQQCNEEPALKFLTDKNYQYINYYYKRLNIKYNFPACETGLKHLEEIKRYLEPPIKVLHFHPVYRKINYVKANKEAGLLPDRLYKIFRKYAPELCD